MNSEKMRNMTVQDIETITAYGIVIDYSCVDKPSENHTDIDEEFIDENPEKLET